MRYIILDEVAEKGTLQIGWEWYEQFCKLARTLHESPYAGMVVLYA